MERAQSLKSLNKRRRFTLSEAKGAVTEIIE